MKCITVLGAGTMGRQIARMFATRGYITRLYDAYAGVINEVKHIFGDIDHLEFHDGLADAVAGADLVIESICEDLTAKRTLYVDIAPLLKGSAVVASNTSSFSLKELSFPRPFPNAIALVHFFNPADIVPLVEVVKPPHMDHAVFQKIIDLLTSCGKAPVVLKKDVPGFIANRLQSAVLREACHLVASGVASEADVDTTMREGIGLRWSCAGPFQIADYGGLDIWSKVLQSLLSELDGSIGVPKLITKNVIEGRLGQKTGRGFYEYGPEIETRLSAYRAAILKLLSSRENDGVL